MHLPVLEVERIKHRQTKDEFAAMLGVTRRTVQNWQNGKTELPLSKLLMLAKAWGCSTDYLLGLDTDQAANQQSHPAKTLGGRRR